MGETILNASARPKQSGRFREKGFLPGVIYGANIANAISVKFETKPLRKVIAKHGDNAKVWVLHDNDKKFGFIKEVQRDVVSGQIRHIDVQIVSKDQEIKLVIPIVFQGVEALVRLGLQLQVYKPETTVSGTMDLMPNAIHVDVSEMQLGDSITADKFGLDEQLNMLDPEDTVYGVIINIPVFEEEEEEEETEIGAEAGVEAEQETE